MSDKKEYLPMGSIVLLKGGWKRVMIYGRKQKHLESNKEYDYIACLYPEGNLRADKCVFFNNEDIAEIIHRGFTDEEDEVFTKKFLTAGMRQ